MLAAPKTTRSATPSLPSRVNPIAILIESPFEDGRPKIQLPSSSVASGEDGSRSIIFVMPGLTGHLSSGQGTACVVLAGWSVERHPAKENALFLGRVLFLTPSGQGLSCLFMAITFGRAPLRSGFRLARREMLAAPKTTRSATPSSPSRSLSRVKPYRHPH